MTEAVAASRFMVGTNGRGYMQFALRPGIIWIPSVPGDFIVSKKARRTVGVSGVSEFCAGGRGWGQLSPCSTIENPQHLFYERERDVRVVGLAVCCDCWIASRRLERGHHSWSG